ncbi:MAG TPA: NINE protein [Rhodocyclaceae bacterium]|nr:NINE protein [Rhodocyclaceae bacterium]
MSENVYAAPSSKVELSTKQCGECGETINKKAVVCPKCGVAQKQAVSKVALLLITFFLGGLGGHKFYLKKPWWGVLYLLFFWTYIPTLAALIEFVIYACTSEERLNEKYESGGGSTVVIAVVAAFVMIAVIGILAAIAIPQYHEYTVRAKAAQAMQSANELRMEVEQFAVKNGRLPNPGEIPSDARSVPNVASILLAPDNTIVVRFLPNLSPIGDKTIEIKPSVTNGNLSWTCSGGTAEPRFRPPSCRQ